MEKRPIEFESIPSDWKSEMLPLTPRTQMLSFLTLYIVPQGVGAVKGSLDVYV
jgi:hypothetical protein